MQDRLAGYVQLSFWIWEKKLDIFSSKRRRKNFELLNKKEKELVDIFNLHVVIIIIKPTFTAKFDERKLK